MSSLRYEISQLGACVERALSFRNLTRTRARDRAYLEWRYLRRPSAESATVVWAHDSDAMAGVATIAAHEFVSGGARRIVGLVGDISVAASHRGRGIGSELLAHVQEIIDERFDGGLVLPNDAAESALDKAGWLKIGSIRRFVRILSASPSEVGGPKRSIVRTVAYRTLAGTNRLLDLAAQARGPRGYRIELESVPDSRFDDLWRRFVQAHAVCACRDSRYLRWRYSDHPTDHFQILSLSDASGLCGYAIVQRLEATFHIVDYLASGESAARALALRVVEWARAAGASEMQVRYFYPGHPLVPWSRLGFVRRRDTQAVMVTPKLARDMRSQPCYLTMGDKDV